MLESAQKRIDGWMDGWSPKIQRPTRSGVCARHSPELRTHPDHATSVRVQRGHHITHRGRPARFSGWWWWGKRRSWGWHSGCQEILRVLVRPPCKAERTRKSVVIVVGAHRSPGPELACGLAAGLDLGGRTAPFGKEAVWWKVWEGKRQVSVGRTRSAREHIIREFETGLGSQRAEHAQGRVIFLVYTLGGFLQAESVAWIEDGRKKRSRILLRISGRSPLDGTSHFRCARNIRSSPTPPPPPQPKGPRFL